MRGHTCILIHAEAQSWGRAGILSVSFTNVQQILTIGETLGYITACKRYIYLKKIWMEAEKMSKYLNLNTVAVIRVPLAN